MSIFILMMVKKYNGIVVDTGQSTDITVVEINSQNFYSGEFGNSDNLKPGQIIIAISNSLGLYGEPTVIVGVISAIRRNIASKQVILENMIQTDATINPGNRGVPLIDGDSKVIGINTAINPYAQGIGFAVPINITKNVANELMSYGRIIHPWLGILGINMNPVLASYYNLKVKEGALIVRINENSPANHAGLQPGDIIIKISEKAIKGMEDLRKFILKQKAGEKLKIQRFQKHQHLTGTINLAETLVN